MHKAFTDEPLINYAGDDNLLVVPITGFVRKDGHVALVDEDAKLISEKYPEMTKYFGYMVQNDITAPVFRREGINVLGIVDRGHYASALDVDLVSEGIMRIADAADEYQDMLVYLFPFGGDEDTNKEMFAESKNVVLLIREDRHEQEAG